VGDLGAVVRPPTLLMARRQAHVTEGGPIGAQLVGGDPGGGECPDFRVRAGLVKRG
jgi:hypothetical protein